MKIIKCITADPLDWEKLEKIKDETGLSISHMLRMAIKRIIEEKRIEAGGLSCEW